MRVENLNIVSIRPDQKDLDRVDQFQFNTSFGRCRFYGNGAPSASGAKKMAKAIKDPEKLVRRAKAVVERWGIQDWTGFSQGQPIIENPWKPFRSRLQELGFSSNQISQIEYRT